MKEVFRLGAKHQVGNGTSTRFWSDWWIGPGPLRERQPAIFAITHEPEITVAQAFCQGGWTITCRRVFGPVEQAQWINLQRELDLARLSQSPDRMIWTLEPSGRFSVSSLYRRFCEGTPRKHFCKIWRVATP